MHNFKVELSAVLRNFNERRDAEGQFLSGLVCGLDSDDVRKQNIQEALERLSKLAEQGDTAAQEFLKRNGFSANCAGGASCE